MDKVSSFLEILQEARQVPAENFNIKSIDNIAYNKPTRKNDISTRNKENRDADKDDADHFKRYT